MIIPTKEFLNQFIKEKAMGGCWHKWKPISVNTLAHKWICTKCGQEDSDSNPIDPDYPDYCSDESPRSLLHSVINKIQELNYLCDIYQIKTGEYVCDIENIHTGIIEGTYINKSESTAICLAIWEALTIKCPECDNGIIWNVALMSSCLKCQGTGRIYKDENEKRT